MENTRERLLKNPDTSSLSYAELSRLYEEVKANLSNDKPIPDILLGLFWYFTCANSINGKPRDQVEEALKFNEAITTTKLDKVDGY